MRLRAVLLLFPTLAACGANTEPEPEPFVPPDPPPIGLQLHMKPITIAPGEDVEFCTYFNLDLPQTLTATDRPFLLQDLVANGIDPEADEIAVGKIDVKGAPGLHHIQILALEKDLEDVEDRHIFECAIDLFGGPLTGDVDPLFFTSLNDFSVEYPPGVARVLKRVDARDRPEGVKRGTQLLYNFHYLNVTEKPITAEVVVNLHTVPVETVEHPVRSAWWNYVYFEATAGQKSVADAKGSFLVDVNLVGMTSHLHELGTLFTYEKGGEEIYSNNDWAEPDYLNFDAGTVLPKGEEIKFHCEWDNPHSASRYFGLQADDEMCTAIIEYYPVDEAEAEALLESQREANMQMGGSPFSGSPVTLESFVPFPEDLLQQIAQDPDNAFDYLDQDIICGIALNLKQMERQYGESPELLNSIQPLIEFLEPICRL